MTKNLVADVSSYQPNTLGFFKKLKKNGIKAVMVKLTDGTSYLNPSAGLQVSNAFKAGIKSVGLYHYFEGNPVEEATYFLKWVHAFKMDKDTPLALDVEDGSLPRLNTHLVNVFMGILKKNGYTCRIVYSNLNFFSTGRLKYDLLADKNVWLARYEASEPGMDHVKVWQYTDDFKGMHVDASIDFTGIMTGSSKPKKPAKHKAKDSYISDGHKFKVIGSHLSLYSSATFDSKTDTGLLFAKNTIFEGTPVRTGSIYRICLPSGKFVSANTKFTEKK